MIRSRPPRKVTYFEPVAPRLARNTIIESTFEVGRRFRCTMRVDCGELDPGAVIQAVSGEWHPRMPEQLDEGTSRSARRQSWGTRHSARSTSRTPRISARQSPAAGYRPRRSSSPTV